jgi:hypothetical protein
MKSLRKSLAVWQSSAGTAQSTLKRKICQCSQILSQVAFYGAEFGMIMMRLVCAAAKTAAMSGKRLFLEE